MSVPPSDSSSPSGFRRLSPLSPPALLLTPPLRAALLSSASLQAVAVPRGNFLAPPSLAEGIPDSLPLHEKPGAGSALLNY
ncbi:hypothetical protein NDU88_000358 [Pleurodeles waltl]|uniref:Uncharacterized protein n=1 Tax=Pleurodeles waltl TaxID=8319 RepID=A0AAV7UQT8_PLEWA|nr:hypothetical protein NDU88_000358 [Pleurodeles waltl]